MVQVIARVTNPVIIETKVEFLKRFIKYKSLEIQMIDEKNPFEGYFFPLKQIPIVGKDMSFVVPHPIVRKGLYEGAQLSIRCHIPLKKVQNKIVLKCDGDTGASIEHEYSVASDTDYAPSLSEHTSVSEVTILGDGYCIERMELSINTLTEKEVQEEHSLIVMVSKSFETRGALEEIDKVRNTDMEKYHSVLKHGVEILYRKQFRPYLNQEKVF
jgi:hypothetical protein